jgi:hypothetical protein
MTGTLDYDQAPIVRSQEFNFPLKECMPTGIGFVSHVEKPQHEKEGFMMLG